MNRGMAVRDEVRKLTSSKPVHAVAGAGALASSTLRELPARIAHWRSEGTLTGYMTTARTRASQEYDKLALRGQQVLHARRALNGKGGSAKKS